jgi:hypothetical protein
MLPQEKERFRLSMNKFYEVITAIEAVALRLVVFVAMLYGLWEFLRHILGL